MHRFVNKGSRAKEVHNRIKYIRKLYFKFRSLRHKRYFVKLAYTQHNTGYALDDSIKLTILFIDCSLSQIPDQHLQSLLKDLQSSLNILLNGIEHARKYKGAIKSYQIKPTLRSLGKIQKYLTSLKSKYNESSECDTFWNRFILMLIILFKIQ